jgi:hypothetical protein
MKEKAEKYNWVDAKCVAYDGRICFGIAYFGSEEDATEYAAKVKAQGITYNGGWYHGRPCGRDKTWDHVDKETGKALFAVTD